MGRRSVLVNTSNDRAVPALCVTGYTMDRIKVSEDYAICPNQRLLTKIYMYESNTDVGTDRNISTRANHDDVGASTQCRG